MGTVRKYISMDEESARLLESYSGQLGLTQSAMIRLMLRSINTGIEAVEKPAREEKRDAGQSGDD